MQLEKLLKRINSKITTQPNGCQVWTGSTTISGMKPKLVRNHQGQPNISPVYRHPRSRITYEGKTMPVERLLYTLANPTSGPFKVRKLCTTPLCVNLDHHRFAPQGHSAGLWTLEEAIELVTLYKANNPGLWDPSHTLLCELPPDLLKEARDATTIAL